MEKKELDWSKIDQELKHSHLFLNSIFENIPNMVFVKDAEDLRFIYFNKAGEELLGYKRRDLIGKNDYDFFTKEEADFFTKKDLEVVASGKLYDIPEELIHTKKKGIRILHTKKIPILETTGKPLYLLGISEDITDRKKLEKEVLDISEREQQRLGQDLHDGLGQHLTGIALLLKGLAQKLKAKKIPEANDAAEIGDLANQAIAQTRDLARLLYPLELQTHGLMSALQELVSNTRKRLRIQCGFKCSEPFHFTNKILINHLYRIAQESLDNAIKHSKASKITVELSRQGKNYILKIADDGKGLPSKFKLGKGNGMGMAIMKHRASMIGATIKFKKKIPHGTEVVCSWR